jgi:hypothetical protein
MFLYAYPLGYFLYIPIEMNNLDMVERFKNILVEMRSKIDSQLIVLDNIERGKSLLSPHIISLTCLKHYFLFRDLLESLDSGTKDFYLDLKNDRSILQEETILLLEEHKKEKETIAEILPIILLYLINKPK